MSNKLNTLTKLYKHTKKQIYLQQTISISTSIAAMFCGCEQLKP